MAPAPPTDFVCPLTGKLMGNPMMSRYGNHFERSAILKWLNDGNSYCPVTGNPLRASMLISDKTLQWKIEYWAKKHGYDLGTGEEKDEESSAFVSMGTIAIPHPHFICPLTNEIMTDPVVSREDINFERKAILQWLDKEDFCPVTKKPLTPTGLIPNSKLKWEIDQWQLRSGDPSELMTKLELEGKISKAVMISRAVPLADMVQALAIEQAGDSSTKPSHPKKMEKADILSALDDVADLL